jgi:hypothetical protein
MRDRRRGGEETEATPGCQTSGQAREKHAASVHGCTGTPLVDTEVELKRERAARPGRTASVFGCTGTTEHHKRTARLT